MDIEQFKQYLAPHQIEAFEHEKSTCDVFSLSSILKMSAPYHADSTKVRLVFYCEKQGHNYEFEIAFVMPGKFNPPNPQPEYTQTVTFQGKKNQPLF
jgi:hypothetical protein